MGEAKVIPVCKSGNRSNITNYQTISVFLKVSYTTIIVWNQISLNQHYFMRQRSTTNNLTIVSRYDCETVDEGGQIDVYIDLSKAFDTWSGSFFAIITNIWIFRRSDRRLVNFYSGFKLYAFNAISSILQGSNLGPLMFLVFFNNLDHLLTVRRLFFAADLKVYTSVNMSDC